MFLSYVEGISLDKIWSSLTTPLKQSLQQQLEGIFQNLRLLPLLPKSYGNGHPARCKDFRRHLRTSTTEIHNEHEFNTFLTSSNPTNVSASYLRIVRSQLRTDHKTYLTHADLHPGNIMVSHGMSNIAITGIIDWELSGNYPEYWEFVKAHNRLHLLDNSDWYDYLPMDSIGTYENEYLVNNAIDALA